MKNEFIHSAVFIDVKAGVLNNQGIDETGEFKNGVLVKKINVWDDENEIMKSYPYVSSQAWRYWMRKSLEKNFSWEMSGVKKIGKNQAVTKTDPFTYPDDDMFGYMSAIKVDVVPDDEPEVVETKKKKKKETDNKTVKRYSPLKTSFLVSIAPQRIVKDFGMFNRHEEGDPIIYNHEFYKNVLFGNFTIEQTEAGRFRDGQFVTTKNVEDYKKEGEYYYLPETEKKQRIRDVILSNLYMNECAVQTRHLTDITPSLMILCRTNSGNNFLCGVSSETGINIKYFEQVLNDYKQNIIGDLYIARREGFLDEKHEELVELSKNYNINYNLDGSFNKTVIAFCDSLG